MTSDDNPIRESEQIRQDCTSNLWAERNSTHFPAVLGCLLGEDWIIVKLIEMVITPDGHVLDRCDGDGAFTIPSYIYRRLVEAIVVPQSVTTGP